MPHIQLGQEVEVLIDQDAETNQKMTGKVYWISESAEFTPKIIQTKEERVNMVYAVKIRVKNDGVLKIEIPKIEKARSKTIKIKTSGPKRK